MRSVFPLAALALVLAPAAAFGADIRGVYVESRTCQVYTGPCFANAETALAGKNAIMAWSIEKGAHQNVDLSGLNVVVVLAASDTLAFQGIDDAEKVKSLILVDKRANKEQKQALINFAKAHSGKAGKTVVRIDTAPIEMKFDISKLTGNVKAGKEVTLETRKARPDDCICSNESAYYPPLAKLKNFAPGVAIQGEFSGRGLGAKWSNPGDRSAYLGVFAY